MADNHQNRLVERIVSGHAIVVLCAPPGFGKMRLADEAARLISNNDGAAIARFGIIEHKADPRAAALAFLSDCQRVTVVEEVFAAEGRLLVQALERVEMDRSGKRAILVLNQPSDLPMARILARRSVDILDAGALRLRPQETIDAIKAAIRPSMRTRIRDLVGDWPIALELLCAWGSGAHSEYESWTDLDILRECRLGEFIEQEVLPLFTPSELTALVHASLLNTPDLSMLSAISRHNVE